MSEVVLVCGCPASGKSTVSKGFADKGYTYLNRDKAGGKVIDLLPAFEAALQAKQNIVIDNLFATELGRAPFIVAAKKHGADIHCQWMSTSIEDAIINALHRMWERYGKLFLTPESLKDVKDPNMFPIAVFFRYRKELQKPTTGEGFTSVKKIPFVRRSSAYAGKAIICDLDDTVRSTPSGSPEPYPTSPEEVVILPKRKEVLQKYKKDGYMVLAASNQSGIAKGTVTAANALAAIERTNKLLDGVIAETVICPHYVPPTCYCRKPASGMGVQLIESWKLNPQKCIFVGDSTSDRTFATRLGMEFAKPEEFFK
ncbi:MAG: HAD-IIIA family hydrolase [Proteobacteria bacterium]|jgi:HAD superfamily hydrolase (TIGR01662 family)|nr:HAD-IIIA family hydrolase [Pseudomonadota bacterium]